ncbi:MAG TPA: hypothetical protein PKL97_03050 [Candidatus Omnitrophota bacterium]|nr:hypothetical protein [Candidatus Omnitrophota bacterium]
MKIILKFLAGTGFFIAFLFVSCGTGSALDALDLFKFDYQTRVELQSNRSVYDPAKPYGVISPLTDYICRVTARILGQNRLPDAWRAKLDGLSPGGVLLDFVSPQEIAEIPDEVLKRNYTGAQFFFKTSVPFDTILERFRDRANYYRAVPGMAESKLIEARGNRFDVRTVRETSASVFGMRESVYSTADIEAALDGGRKEVVKVQLLKDPEGSSGSLLFYDSLWYFESIPEGTAGFYLTFSCLPWDCAKTPKFFPLLSNEVRRQVVRHFLDGVAETVLAFLATTEDPRLREKNFSDFTAEDKKLAEKIINTRKKEMHAARSGHRKFPWNGLLGKLK